MSEIQPSITVALIAKNEEQHIEKCLWSVSGLDAEAVVVDTGSQDRTKEIAAKCGAKVFEFPWIDDFSAARNRAIEHARCRWILILDADEYLPPSSVEAIRSLTADGIPADRAYHLLNKSSSDGGRTGTTGEIVRLFPNDPRIRYEWPVHEQVVTSLQRAQIPIEHTQIEIIHTGYSNPEINCAKQKRNLRILQRMTADPQWSGHAMPWFLQGGALLDQDRTQEALICYQRCTELTNPEDSLHHAGLVRCATCFHDTNQMDSIRKINPAIPETEWHPELLLLRGQAELALGDIRAGLTFLHRVFESPTVPRIPAYNSVKTKARAMMSIASLWQQTDPARAVEMLKIASQAMQEGREISFAEVFAVETA